MMQMPPDLQQPQHYSVSQMGIKTQSAPSKEEVEDLKKIDVHFNKITSHKTKRLSAGPADTTTREEITTKNTVTITKHVCANCGRLRSRKYHAENTIKAEDTPIPAFCRKCQKYSSETSDSDDPKPKNLNVKEKKSNEQKKVCIS